MKRGQLWTIAGGPGFAGKPRPALIVQSDDYGATETITVCPVTSTDAKTAMLRPSLMPDPGNGLDRPSSLMIDKITTLSRNRLGRHIGTLSDEDLARADRVLLVFLGLAD